MELKNQVCSQKLSEKLEKLGVKQESLWMWQEMVSGWEIFPTDVSLLLYGKDGIDRLSAFTVAELIKRLGKKFGVLDRFKDGTFGAYIPNNIGVSGLGKTPQEALGNLLIRVYSLENKLTK